MSSKLKLTGTGGGDTIIQGNDSITTDQTFTFPDNGGELVTETTGSTIQPFIESGSWSPDYGFWSGGVLQHSVPARDQPSHPLVQNRWQRVGDMVTCYMYTRYDFTGLGSTYNTFSSGFKLPLEVEAFAPAYVGYWSQFFDAGRFSANNWNVVGYCNPDINGIYLNLQSPSQAGESNVTGLELSRAASAGLMVGCTYRTNGVLVP